MSDYEATQPRWWNAGRADARVDWPQTPGDLAEERAERRARIGEHEQAAYWAGYAYQVRNGDGG